MKGFKTSTLESSFHSDRLLSSGDWGSSLWLLWAWLALAALLLVTTWLTVRTALLELTRLVRSNGNTLEITKINRLKEISSVGINIDNIDIEDRLLWDEVKTTLTLLLLELEGDTTDRATTLDALHQMGDETGNLVAETLRWDDGNLLGNLLVGVEIESQPDRQGYW